MKVFNEVKLTLFEYSLFIFKASCVWVFIVAPNEGTAVKPNMYEVFVSSTCTSVDIKAGTQEVSQSWGQWLR